MSEKTKETVRRDGVVHEKTVSDQQQTTPKPHKSDRSFSAILETLPIAKRQLFEKRGIIRTSPKLVAHKEESKTKETTRRKKKKSSHKVDLRELKKDSPPVVVSNCEDQFDKVKKKRKLKKKKAKLGQLNRDGKVKSEDDTLGLPSLGTEFTNESTDPTINQKIIAKTSQHLLHSSSKRKKLNLSKGKEKYFGIKPTTPIASAKTIPIPKVKTKLAQTPLKQPPSTASNRQVIEAPREQNKHAIDNKREKNIVSSLNAESRDFDSQPDKPSSKKSKKRTFDEVDVDVDSKTNIPDLDVDKEKKRKKKKKKKKTKAQNLDKTMKSQNLGTTMKSFAKNIDAGVSTQKVGNIDAGVSTQKVADLPSDSTAQESGEICSTVTKTTTRAGDNEITTCIKASIPEGTHLMTDSIKTTQESDRGINDDSFSTEMHGLGNVSTLSTKVSIKKANDEYSDLISGVIKEPSKINVMTNPQKSEIDRIACTPVTIRQPSEGDNELNKATQQQRKDTSAVKEKAKEAATLTLSEHKSSKSCGEQRDNIVCDMDAALISQERSPSVKSHPEYTHSATHLLDSTTEDNTNHVLPETVIRSREIPQVDKCNVQMNYKPNPRALLENPPPSTQEIQSAASPKVTKMDLDEQIPATVSQSFNQNDVGIVRSSANIPPSLKNSNLVAEIEEGNLTTDSSLEIGSLVSNEQHSPLLEMSPNQVDSQISLESLAAGDCSSSVSRELESTATDTRMMNDPIESLEPNILRKATYILDRLFATSLSRAFISPFGTAHLYEPPPGGLNLTIVERKLWYGRYNTFSEFIEDLKRIAEAVRVGYDNTDEIYLISKEFVHLFESLAWDMRSHPPAEADRPENQEVSPFSIQELKDTVRDLECTQDSVFYIVKLATLEEVTRSNCGLLEKEVCASIHNPFFESFGSTPDVLTCTASSSLPTVLRVFVSHNRTTLELARDEQNGFLLVFTNVKKSSASAKDHIRLQADCFVTKPIGRRHDIQDVEILQSLDSMKSWIKVVVLKAFKFDAEVPSKFRSLYLLKPFRPVRYDPRIMDASQLSQAILNTKNYWNPAIVEKSQSEIVRDPIEISLHTTRSTPTTKTRKAKKSSATSSLGHSLKAKRNAIIQESPTVTPEPDSSTEEIPQDYNEFIDIDIEEHEEENSSNIFNQTTGFVQSTSKHTTKELIAEIQNNIQAFRESARLTERDIRALNESQLPPEARAIYLRIKEAGLNLGINFKDLDENISQSISQNYVVGCTKNVYINANDTSTVVQFYRNIDRESVECRLIELSCLLKLRGVKRIGEVRTILESKNDSPIGFIMNRYQKTLKQYLHNRCNISPQQKYKLMRDLIAAVKALHDQGISHRNLSDTNVMVNEVEGVFLKDGTYRPKIVLIDFRKARFTRKEDIQQWRVNLLGPEEENLLPRIRVVPDHEHKYYRSIGTLPRSRQDTDVLPHSIDPFAEDVYSLGVLLWRISTQKSLWGGVFEDDIIGLRQIVGDERRLRTAICKAIPGSKCRELMFGCLSVNAENRWNINQLSEWIWKQQNRKQLLSELARDFQRPHM